jgi:hypothetical protein
MAVNLNSPIVGLRVASVIFGLVSVAQLVRLVARIDVLVSGRPLPLWPSAMAFLVAGGLSVWMWRLSATGAK